MRAAGEKLLADGAADQAESAAARAREELRRAGAAEEFAARLDALDAAIGAAAKAVQWRQKAGEEIDGALKCVQLAEVRHFTLRTHPI